MVLQGLPKEARDFAGQRRRRQDMDRCRQGISPYSCFATGTEAAQGRHDASGRGAVSNAAAKGEDAEGLLNGYGEAMGRRFARIIHALTSLPGVDRLVWRHVGSVMKKASSENLGYRSQLVSEPPEMYGVDILSCPYHELAKALGNEKAVLCICHMDKEYSQGFRHIRYDRNSAVSEGARACEYRLRFDAKKA
ncbi:MAG: hypothetical protein E7337_17765 [Clostridiales bacterium]|nr:hypothetical protein [Clostridiales bacterium]